MSGDMIQVFHIQIVCEFRFFFQQKVNHFQVNSPNINKNLSFEVTVVFSYFFRFSHTYIVCCGFIPREKCFTSVSLLPFTKKIGKSSYDVTMNHHDIILILSLFRFVTYVQDLQWDNFLVLTMNRKELCGFICHGQKRHPPGFTRAYNTPSLIGLKIEIQFRALKLIVHAFRINLVIHLFALYGL